MDVTKKETDSALVFAVRGRLDSVSSPKLGEALEPAIAEDERALVLDLSETVYVSSAGLRVMLSTTKRLKSAGRKIAVCGLSDNIMDVIRVTGFHHILDIEATLDEALEAVS